MGEVQRAWRCESCGAPNKPGAVVCDKCDSPPPPPDPPGPPHPVAPVADPPAPRRPVAPEPAPPPAARPVPAPPVAAPPAPQQKSSNANWIAALTCLGCFACFALYSGINTTCESIHMHNALNNAEFTTTADVDAFIAELELEYERRPDGGWEAEHSWHQDFMDELQGRWTVLHREESRSELRRLLAADPGESCQAYISTLEMLYQEAKAPDLEEQVAARIAEFREPALREQITLLLARDNITNHDRYIRELKSVLADAPAELKPLLEERIAEQKALEDQR